ncbi:MAG: restriction endonuclease [Deltaproteobacteria bacterium]|nr:restriction endonuclease [Deltaproteobacteria bacterium]
MNERVRSSTIVAPRRRWRDRTGRGLVLKGTAAFLLLVFATIFLHGNWPIALLWVGGGAGLWWLSGVLRRQRERAEILKEVEAMSDTEFRRYAADLLRAQGYIVNRNTWSLEEQRAALLLTRGRTSFVCRLQRQEQRVGKGVVAEVLAALERYEGARGIILTNSFFTLPARNLARRESCVLIDRRGLATLVAQHRQGHRVLTFQREEIARLRKRK